MKEFDALYKRRPEPKDRLLSKVQANDKGCWIWTGYTRRYNSRSDGYGEFRLYGVKEYAHRAAYLLFKGPIPNGMELDHLCRNRNCVNPTHLETVTHAENILRSLWHHYKLQRDHCPNGHRYTEQTTGYAANNRSILNPGKRFRRCKICKANGQRRYNAKKRSSKEIR